MISRREILQGSLPALAGLPTPAIAAVTQPADTRLSGRPVAISASGLDAGFAGVPRILLSHGARDALVLPGMSRRMLAVNPRSSLSIYPDAGHSPSFEDAARFNRELAAFAALTTSRKAPS